MLEFANDPQYSHAGQNLKWFSIDNEFRFNQNKPSGWNKDSIEYRFNGHGFRMDIEMYDIKGGSNIYIGDSTTMGFGCNLEDTWAFKHHQKNNVNNTGDYVNLGCTAGTLDTVYRILKFWIPIIEPKNIFLLEPAPYRQEFIRPDGVSETIAIWETIEIQQMSGHEITDTVSFKDKLFKDYVSSPLQVETNKNKNMDAILKVCENSNLTYVDHPPFTEEYFGEARDTHHAGPQQNDKILEYFVAHG